jgi:hypothetical protein
LVIITVCGPAASPVVGGGPPPRRDWALSSLFWRRWTTADRQRLAVLVEVKAWPAATMTGEGAVRHARPYLWRWPACADRDESARQGSPRLRRQPPRRVLSLCSLATQAGQFTASDGVAAHPEPAPGSVAQSATRQSGATA